MAERTHTSISFPNRSYQGIVRSEIKRIAYSAGFTDRRMGELEIVVAEITSNLVKHTTAGGEILVKILSGDNGPGIEIIAIDKGPGMRFPLRMMEDGISSVNTLGQGLGAIQRLSDEFDLYSQIGWGTVLFSRMYLTRPENYVAPKTAELSILIVPKPGETACGDAFTSWSKGNQYKLMVADGLGHGPDAEAASHKAADVFMQNLTISPNDQLRLIHTEIKKTRGAVISVANIDLVNKQITYCGVGNISGKISSPVKSRSCISYNGIVGHNIPTTLHNHLLIWENNDVLIMHSDGLTTRWDLQKYPGITRHCGTIIAAALYKDHTRGNDDTLVMVFRKINKQ